MTLVTSWFCVIALVLLSGASAADTPLKILAIGDSITAGGGPPSGATEDAATYRHDLEALLESHGIPAEFVGDICQNCKISGGLWNERCDMGCKRGSEKDKFIAFWGWLSTQILDGNGPSWSRMDGADGKGLKNLIADLEFNVAIIHLGTNDLGHRRSAQEIGDTIFQIVEVIRARSPSCKILVSQLIPISSRWRTEDSVQKLNKHLASEAAVWNTTKSPVYIVDCYTGFDVDKHTVDQVHPNKAGAALMASRIFTVLTGLPAAAKDASPRQGVLAGAEDAGEAEEEDQGADAESPPPASAPKSGRQRSRGEAGGGAKQQVNRRVRAQPEDRQ